jgi:hypothetical protein
MTRIIVLGPDSMAWDTLGTPPEPPTDDEGEPVGAEVLCLKELFRIGGRT